MTPAFYPATYWGGPITSVYGLCKALASRPDIIVTVLTTDAAGRGRHQRVAPDEMLKRSATGFETHYCRRILLNAVSIELLAKLGEMVAASDIVHLTGVYSATTFPTLVSCKTHRKPLVWSPRGSWQEWTGRTRPLLKRMWDALAFSLVAPQRTAIHATSEAEAAAIAHRRGPGRIVCIPNAVDIPTFIEEPRESAPDPRFGLLFLGRIHRIKGLDVLLRALALCDPARFTLTIAGTGDADYVEELKRLSRELRVDSRVTWTGHLGEAAKAAAYRAADLVVVPSHSENFGMTVVEALAHGVPVMASTGTPWSRIAEMKCGWWIDPDPRSIAGVLSEVSGLQLRAMGENGRQWVQSEFSWASVSDQMSAVYTSLLNA